MRAMIHEIINDDNGYHPGNTYAVPDLDEELERLDQSGAIYHLVAALPDRDLEGMQVTLEFFI